MKIQAKDIIIILLGVIGVWILKIISNKWVNFEEPFINDNLITIIVAIVAITYVIYKRIGEIDDEIEEVKEINKKLDERLKIYKELTKLDARLIALEKNKNGKKR